MSYRRATGLLLAGFVMSLVGSGVAAGEGPEVFGLKTSGDLTVGGRIFIEKPSKQEEAKFEEYRDLPESAFAPYLRLRGDSKDDFYTVEFLGENVGQTDQMFQLRSYGVGQFNFLFEWNQIPHIFCTNCRTLFTENPQATFNLPNPRPSPLSVWNSAPEIDQIGFRTDVATVGGSYNPTPDWDIGVNFSLMNKHGDRPVGLAFGSPGNQAAEVPVPIENTTYGVHVNAGYAGKGYQLQLGYDLSIFDQEITSFRVDNPCWPVTTPGAALPTACGNSSTATAPETGQGSRFPGNWATGITLAGGVNLPMRTRLTGSFSYSWRFQDENFLPFTINPTLAANPTIVTAQGNLPGNLDGQVNILRFNLAATSRLTDDLTGTANFRVYDYQDNTPSIPFTAYVEDDRSIQSGASLNERARLARRYPYTKYNAGADLRYQLFDPLTVKVAFGWERWVRSADLLTVDPALVEPGGASVLNVPREVATTNEYTPKVMLDYTPLDWLLFRLSYSWSQRDGTDYLQASEEQLALLRKYSMADRTQNRVDFLANIMAMENVTFTPTFSYRDDDYGDSQYGLTDAKDWSAGVDVSWRPLGWLSVYGGYLYEEVDSNSRSKFRTPSGGGIFNNPTYDWVSETTDRFNTFRVGADATIIPKRLEGGLNFNYSMGQTIMNTFNPQTPTGGGAQDANAVAEDFPGIQTTLSQLNVFLRYWITDHFTAKINYSFEKWNQSDFRFDNLQPFNFPNPNTGDTIFLGMDPENYTAQWITLSVGYHF